MADQPRLLEGLDPEQRAAVMAPRGPVCVLAGAGTGKTRTVTHRIAYLAQRGLVSPQQVLAVTFTARAAGEMRTRLRALGANGVQAQTFHAAAFRQLRYFWPRVHDMPVWSLLDNKFRLVMQAASGLGLSTEKESVRDIASEIEWSKASLIGPEAYPAAASRAGRDVPIAPDLLAQCFTAYEQVKNTARALDFDDLLLHMAAIVEEHPDVAEEFRARYRSFVVDEYQDVTPLQQRVLDAWLGERDDLTVVGDANQTIYSFAGAAPKWLIDFPRRFSTATIVRLERDYRSTPQVVSLANRVIEAAESRQAGSRLRLVGQREDGPKPEFAEYEDEPAEAQAIARKIAGLAGKGTPLSEIAVLFRVNAQSEVYEKALSEADIPYQLRGGERFFTRPEVRQAMVSLRAAGTRGEMMGDELPATVRAVLSEVGLTEEPPSGSAARQRWDSLIALVELAEELVGTEPDADLARYLGELEVRAESQHPPTVEGVTLASLHTAKGLEWDAVFLVGLADGTLPITYAEGTSAIEEERRLLYVGVTRAREHLHLSWALARAAGGRQYRKPSRFVFGLNPAEDSPAPQLRGTRPGSGHKAKKPQCRGCAVVLVNTMDIKLGRCSECPSDVDEDLLAQLKSWRGERARQLKVPAYVVFTDATLTAIAEQRPSDVAGLVRISGIGATKVERFGSDVLALIHRL